MFEEVLHFSLVYCLITNWIASLFALTSL